MDASLHFIYGEVERYGFHPRPVVDRGFGQNCHHVAVAYQFEQDVDLVELNADIE